MTKEQFKDTIIKLANNNKDLWYIMGWLQSAFDLSNDEELNGAFAKILETEMEDLRERLGI